MEPDFSGYATKADLKCSDGRTILPDAFKHQDNMTVPLVWQHGHTDPTNVLGHVKLENRPDGVYCHAFFNNTEKAKHAKASVIHKDITQLSIWANDLIERSKRVLHGRIREVSLVLSGANPGALIQSVKISHGDGDETELEDEAIIFTGLPIEHSDKSSVSHATGDDETIEDVYNSMSDKQKQVLHFMIGQALEEAGADVQQDDMDGDNNDILEAIATMSETQQALLHTLVDKALNSSNGDDKKGSQVMHNVFEKGNKDSGKRERVVISHDDMKAILTDAKDSGSLKAAVEGYALAHGIEDIEVLFPEAQTLANAPELFGRRVEWASELLGDVRKSPFSRIKTINADITVATARAKGYIKGTLKKEEFFKVARRVTTPTTIYKKQKLDRDDVVDITDFDVVAWLKGEMRIMLDEELARAILVGDGRAADDEDKIDEEKIRPIASDHEVYVTTIYVNLGDASSSFNEVIDAVTMHRSDIRGSGMPTMYTTEKYIARVMTLRDTVGRKIYKTLDELAAELRVRKIVPVEVMEEYDDIVAILVNPIDYVVGADKGGQVAMFEDFDIDYNQQKYLIETRVSGALYKMKSALVVRKVDAGAVLVVPTPPSFDGSDITINTTTGVTYRNAATDAVMTNGGSPYTVASGESLTVVASPSSSGYYFESSNDDEWTFTGE